MLQAAVFECFQFDLLPSVQDDLGPGEVGIGRRHIAQTFMVAMVVIVLDESANLGCEK